VEKGSDSIYREFDFGGFVVKGPIPKAKPGPRDYGRREGGRQPNVIADALGRMAGTGFWCSGATFVISEKESTIRAKQAYNGVQRWTAPKFATNVFVQTNACAIDFQPREPDHPCSAPCPKPQHGDAKVQADQEYLGQATHLVYLPVLWQGKMTRLAGHPGAREAGLDRGPKVG